MVQDTSAWWAIQFWEVSCTEMRKSSIFRHLVRCINVLFKFDRFLYLYVYICICSYITWLCNVLTTDKLTKWQNGSGSLVCLQDDEFRFDIQSCHVYYLLNGHCYFWPASFFFCCFQGEYSSYFPPKVMWSSQEYTTVLKGGQVKMKCIFSG